MHRKMKLTALIILNFNNFEDTINCIESVERYNTAPIKIIVVDNGSTRKEAPAALDRYMCEHFGARYARYYDGERVPAGVLPYATLLVSSTNDGYAQGNNKGLRLVNDDPTVDDVMILNNDILFIEDIIPTLITTRDSIDRCGLISPLLLKRDCKNIDLNCARRTVDVKVLIKENFLHYFRRLRGKSMEQYMRRRFILLDDYPDLESITEVDLPSGSCMLIDKKLFAGIGYFDPGTFLYYEEDILYKKLSAIGYHNYVLPYLRCVHLGAVSTSKRSATTTLRANNLSERYYVKHFSDASLPLRLLHNLSARFFWQTLRIQKRLWPSGLSHDKKIS